MHDVPKVLVDSGQAHAPALLGGRARPSGADDGRSVNLEKGTRS